MPAAHREARPTREGGGVKDWQKTTLGFIAIIATFALPVVLYFAFGGAHASP